MFHIGQVCQTHVWLDDQLGSCYGFLLPRGEFADARKGPLTSRLVDRIKPLLRAADVLVDVRKAGVTALESATKANKDRNRVVHDCGWTASRKPVWTQSLAGRCFAATVEG